MLMKSNNKTKKISIIKNLIHKKKDVRLHSSIYVNDIKQLYFEERKFKEKVRVG